MDILQNKEPGRKLQGSINADYWARNILLFYIFTMPFVSAFSFTGTLSLPLLTGSVLFVLMCGFLIQNNKFPHGFIDVDLLIIFLFLFVVIFSFVINGWGNDKSRNHTVAYFSSLMIFYVTIKFVFFSSKDKNHLFLQVLKFVSYTTIISGVFGVVEFISANVFDVNLNDYIPRPSDAEKMYNASVVGLFYRARGFANESGVFTQMMELFAPITIYYLFFSNLSRWKFWLKIFYTTLIFFSVVFAASSATFIIVPVSVAIAMCFYSKEVILFFKGKKADYFIKLFIAFFIIIIINNYLSLYSNIVLSVTDKMDSSSLDDRTERLDFFYHYFSHFKIYQQLFGGGPAASVLLGFDGAKSIISLYYSLTFETGFIGLFLMICFILYTLFKNLIKKSKLGFFLLISILSGAFHYYFVHDYWVPWFWFVAAFGNFHNYFLSNLPAQKTD